ncbi:MULTISPECIES: hypothetical protein [Veillonella]|uniref:Uncharacterized protein n=1 Tax=Veillonella denticariosi JCM 15641 TaxID=1298594 RepID=A0A2S7ZCH2_9FIRM|nr:MULTISPECIES: hypothetical protein [Veillonella]ETS92816.1 hypothetical protein HMPREF1521_1336 [Veillonella sp. AS16]PQL20986.1 hypothetical protein VEHSUH05_00750 [Veillonella denticariosi JCM 15641]
MRKIFTILSLLWLLSTDGTALATEWYYVGPDASGNQLFIDNDSVQKSKYDALLWLRVNELSGDELRYKVYISRYNHTMETITVDAYMSDGTPYQNVNYNEDPEPIEGNTNGQAIYNLLWN